MPAVVIDCSVTGEKPSIHPSNSTTSTGAEKERKVDEEGSEKYLYVGGMTTLITKEPFIIGQHSIP